MRLAQANAVLDMGRNLKSQFGDGSFAWPTKPLIVSVGEEYAKIEFSFFSDEELGLNRILVTFPVDFTGSDLLNVSPVTVSWDSTES